MVTQHIPKHLDAIITARDAGVILSSFTPHTTHKLQPHDVSVFKPLQNYYDQDIKKWLRARPDRGITTFHFSQLLGASYIKAATLVNAVNGLRKAGIWSCDRHVFNQEFQIQDESQLLVGPISPVGTEYPFSVECPIGPESPVGPQSSLSSWSSVNG